MVQYKKIRINFLIPHNDNKKQSVFTAPPGCGYTEEQIAVQAAFSLKRAQETFPQYAWRMAQIAPNIFNMIGEKKDDKATDRIGSELGASRIESVRDPGTSNSGVAGDQGRNG